MPDESSDPDRSWTLDTTLSSRRGGHLECLKTVLAQLAVFGWKGRDLFAVEMALEESLSNAIRHGNKHDESKKVFFQCEASPKRFWAKVRDEGPGFDPNTIPDCTDDQHIEACGGRGVMLVRAYMTSVQHNDSGNCVTMEKLRSVDDDGADDCGSENCS